VRWPTLGYVEDLRFAALAGTTVLPNARLFMRALGGSGTRLTTRGNLNRKFVETLLDCLQCDESAGSRGPESLDASVILGLEIPPPHF
jgi:hypothetical protein